LRRWAHRTYWSDQLSSSRSYLLNFARERDGEMYERDLQAEAITENIARMAAYARTQGWAVALVTSASFAVNSNDLCFVRHGVSAITCPEFSRRVTDGSVGSCYLVGDVLTKPGLATLLSMSEFGVPSFVVEETVFPASVSVYGTRNDMRTEALARADFEKLALFVRAGEAVVGPAQRQNIVSLESWRWTKNKHE